LNEALEIITRGNMQLLEADYHLELARLHFEFYRSMHETGHRRQAMLSLADAEALIQKMGYGLRNTEVADLKEEIGNYSGWGT